MFHLSCQVIGCRLPVFFTSFIISSLFYILTLYFLFSLLLIFPLNLIPLVLILVFLPRLPLLVPFNCVSYLMFYSHSRRKLSVLHHSSCLISLAKNHILHFPLKLFSFPPHAPCFPAVLSPLYGSFIPIPFFLPNSFSHLSSSLREFTF